MSKKTSDPSPEKPPVLGSWRNVYLLTMSVLAVLIVLFYLFANRYA